MTWLMHAIYSSKSAKLLAINALIDDSFGKNTELATYQAGDELR